jgi:hypothetical protein
MPYAPVLVFSDTTVPSMLILHVTVPDSERFWAAMYKDSPATPL